MEGVYEVLIGPADRSVYKAGIIVDTKGLVGTRGRQGLRVSLTRSGDHLLPPLDLDIFGLDEPRLQHWLEESRGHILTEMRDSIATFCTEARLNIDFPTTERLVSWRSLYDQPGKLIVVGGHAAAGKTTILYDMIAEFLEDFPSSRAAQLISAELDPKEVAAGFLQRHPDLGPSEAGFGVARMGPELPLVGHLLQPQGPTIFAFDFVTPEQLTQAAELRAAIQEEAIVVLAVQCAREEAQWPTNLHPALQHADVVLTLKERGAPLHILKSRLPMTCAHAPVLPLPATAR